MRQDIIAAISTPPGKGGVAIIRISGAGSIECAREMFRPRSKKALGDYPPRTQIYGDIICHGEPVDDGLMACFPAPGSYTGEDMVEISCHGGMLISKLILEELFLRGARPARAGEFTERAFINGKLTLTDAEAIGALLEAESEEQIRLSSRTSRSHLKSRVDTLASELRELLSSIYARIDYPEEDLGELSDTEIITRLIGIRDNISALKDTYKTGRAINEGVRATICGRPNVGKSTLYNAILGEDAAIVTDVAGTTRDLLERRTTLGRVAVTLTDTAGLHEGSDTVESIGIERAKERISSSELTIAVFDATLPLQQEDMEITDFLRTTPGVKLCILNQKDNEAPVTISSDIPTGVFEKIIYASPKERPAELLAELGRMADRLFTDEKIAPLTDPIVATARQHSALGTALGFIDTAIGAYKLGMPADAASSDIELALGAILELDGRGVSDTVVDTIFSRFCVGK